MIQYTYPKKYLSTTLTLAKVPKCKLLLLTIMKIVYLLPAILSFMFMSEVLAQEQMISGKITSSEDNSTIPGASVQIKNEQQGTITDLDGNFSISASSTDTLVISFIGMTTKEIVVGDQTTINVALDPENRLLETVKIAVGMESDKRKLAYSVQNVAGDELIKANEVNLISGLGGKMAGVQVTSSGGTPGAAAQIRIRGNKSIQGSNSPLFVIDGIPIDNSTFNTEDSPETATANQGSAGVQNSNRLIDINPDDVETMTVLKGPAATVLYGIRAANGAIVITTKKGRKNSKPKIGYTFGYNADRVNKLPDLQNTYGQGATIDTYSAAQDGSTNPFSWGPRISDLRYASDATTPWDPNGYVVLASDPRASDRVAQTYDNPDLFFQTGHTFRNSINVQGGTDAVTYYFSIGRLDQTGIIPNSRFARTSLKATTTAQLTKKLSLSTSANFIRTDSRRVQNGSNVSGVMLGLLRTPASFDNSAGYWLPGSGETQQRSYRGGIYDNPFFTVNENFATDEVNRFLGYLQLNYFLTDWLSFKYRVGADTYGDDRIFRGAIGSSGAPNGEVIDMQVRNSTYNTDFIVNFNKKFNAVTVDVSVGHNFFDNDVHIQRVVGNGLAFPEFFNISSASSVLSTENIEKRRLHGFYLTATVDYEGQFFINLSGRNDRSSTLPLENNSFYYPAISAGWDAVQTLNLTSPMLNYGKIRVSWGQVGNDPGFALTRNRFKQAEVYDGWTLGSGVSFPGFGTNGFESNGILGNNELKAEITTTIEFGTDLRLYKDRIGLDLTYFNALTEDALLNVTIPFSSGYSERTLNSAIIRNKGIEAVLTAEIVRKKDFVYEASANFTRLRNEVERLAPDLEVIRLDPFGSQRVVAGHPFGTFFGTQFLRDDAGNMVIDRATGLPFADPEEGVVGDPNPDFLLGLRNTFSYKGFTFSFLLDIRQGGDVYNGTKGVLNFFGRGAETLDREDRIVFDGVLGDRNEDGSITITGEANDIEIVKGGTAAGGTNPNFYTNYGFVNLTELNIEDGSWMRLRDVSINYQIPAKWLEKVPFGAASVTLSARNLFLITDFTGIDPETNLSGSSSNVFGYDYFNNPNTRSYGVNVNVTF